MAVIDQCVTDKYAIYRGDCVEVLSSMPDDSIHYSIYSPPFASLYVYSDDPRDMGNVRNAAEFFEQYSYLARQLYRVIRPGRLVSVHCMTMPTSKVKDGFIGLYDFRGDIIRSMQAAGWVWHSEVCVWKDPVTQMQRTKALGLLHKTIRKDSAMSRMGLADYVLTFRRPGANDEPIEHGEDLPVSMWQRYASPVWMDIDPGDTLQYMSAREHEDERHICPLQLDVIKRCMHLWSNPGDVVLSPFTGIGSEGVCALEMGRRFVGAELKGSYYEQARRNLDACGRQHSLFGGAL
jgi:DNA modification methylase